ncbi:hypothetical protein [Halomonas cerina]|uniref:Uncharacterized protein n=1 Tax=Halomonas cerina TaxID=447424 RepID=A0A839V3M1_9GAMM|nr:hypothetical protein [Halomonas cerina]MBB3189741.1 hypothetical protein [Halomonas cerina]
MSHKKPTLGNQFSGLFDQIKVRFDDKPTSEEKPEHGQKRKDKTREKNPRGKVKARSSVKRKPSKPKKRNYVEVKAPDTSCYDVPRRPSGSSTSKNLSPVDLPPLHEISADVENLDIHLPNSNAIASPSINPNDGMTARDGEPAIIGLDFGTAFTKAIIHWRNRHYIVDWKDIIDAKDPHLLPSSFSEHTSGSTLLGDVDEAGWTSKKGLKISIIENTADNKASDIDATIFIALVTRYIRGWAEKKFKDMGAEKLRWRLHVGLPASPFQSEKKQDRLMRIASHGWSIGLNQGIITRESVTDATAGPSPDSHIPIKVVPEFLAQLYPYLKSSKSQEGLHGLIDIGAGTVDFVIFNIVRIDNSDKIPIFGDNVSPLGSHYLIGALAGRRGQTIPWHDSDASKSFAFFSERTGEPREEISLRTRIFDQHVKKALGHALKSARSLFTNSPVWRRQNEFPFFLCGGGSHITFYKHSIKNRKSLSIAYRNIPLPKNIVGDINPKSFHRYSVAYGLSILPRNLAAITPKRDIDPVLPPDPIETEDRDASR